MALLLSLCLALLTSSLDSAIPGDAIPDSPTPDYRISRIVIDAGHGGKDPGCVGKQYMEKEVALNIALNLGAKITAQFSDVEVIYTRTTDVFIPLHERAKIANRSSADLFISIHANSVATRNKAMGTETFVLGLHRTDDNLAVAKRENASILLEDDYEEHYDGYDPESDEGHIILSMYQNAYIEQSIALAYGIEEQFVQKAHRQSRGVKQAGFLVLRNTTMPSVLVEAGFLSHDDEEQFLGSEQGQEAIASGIFQAFSDYKQQIEESTVTYQSPEVQSDEPEVGYFVQLVASRTPLDLNSDEWRVYENIKARKEADYYKYLAGPFNTLEAANQARSKFKGDGFDGAFIVVYQGESRISLDEARALTGN